MSLYSIGGEAVGKLSDVILTHFGKASTVIDSGVEKAGQAAKETVVDGVGLSRGASEATQVADGAANRSIPNAENTAGGTHEGTTTNATNQTTGDAKTDPSAKDTPAGDNASMTKAKGGKFAKIAKVGKVGAGIATGVSVLDKGKDLLFGSGKSGSHGIMGAAGKLGKGALIGGAALGSLLLGKKGGLKAILEMAFFAALVAMFTNKNTMNAVGKGSNNMVQATANNSNAAKDKLAATQNQVQGQSGASVSGNAVPVQSAASNAGVQVQMQPTGSAGKDRYNQVALSNAQTVLNNNQAQKQAQAAQVKADEPELAK